LNILKIRYGRVTCNEYRIIDAFPNSIKLYGTQHKLILLQLIVRSKYVLIATSIAEEGLDISEVDLVIFYEPVPSEIRYIQHRIRIENE
jgi:hypothetical protein